MEKKIKEQIKIRKMLLQTLQMPVKNSPYSRSEEEVNRKMQTIYKEIEELQKESKKYETS